MPHYEAAFTQILDENSTQPWMLQSQLETLREPDTNPFECISSAVQHVIFIYFMYCSSSNVQIMKLRMI